MTLPQITLDVPSLKLILAIVAGLLLLAMVRIIFLLRTNRRLRENAEKMEKQVLVQHNEILAVRQDSNAWRGETQRMFDAFRAEFSQRLNESEQRRQELKQRAVAHSQPTVEDTAATARPEPAEECAAALESQGQEAAEEPVAPLPALTLA